MNTLTARQAECLYETDYQLWLANTSEKLRSQNFSDLDLDNLIEELESLGRSERNAICSYLRRLCEHLLKIWYWESERAYYLRGWNREVANFRIEIERELESSPSLRTFLQEQFIKEYQNGRKLFLKASELDPKLIPEQPFFTLDEALDEDWLAQ
jgi:hypothetical protein